MRNETGRDMTEAGQKILERRRKQRERYWAKKSRLLSGASE